MKKLVAGLFVAAFSLAIVGCGEEAKKAPAPKAAEPAKDAKKPDEKKLEPLNEFVAQKLPDNVRDMALSADGKRLAIAYQGGVARVYALA